MRRNLAYMIVCVCVRACLFLQNPDLYYALLQADVCVFVCDFATLLQQGNAILAEIGGALNAVGKLAPDVSARTLAVLN